MIARGPLPITADLPPDYRVPDEAVELVAQLLLDAVESGEGEPVEDANGRGRRGGGV